MSPNARSHTLSNYQEHVVRVALSHYMLNGVSVALGLALVLSLVLELAGLSAASSAAVGLVITSLPDAPAPRKRKVWQMLPAPILGLPLFMLTQALRGNAVLLGDLLVSGTLIASLLLFWGKRGGPLSVSLLFSMLLSLALPPAQTLESSAMHGVWFLLGGGLFVLWAVLTTHALNARYRRQMLAECLHQFAAILRTQAQRFAPGADLQASMTRMLGEQARFAEQLQNTRDIVLENPSTPERERLAAMLLALLEARDHQLACELDLDTLQSHDRSAGVMPGFQYALLSMATTLERWSLFMLLGRTLQALPDLQPEFTADALTSSIDHPQAQALLRNMRSRLGHIHEELDRLCHVARGQAIPTLPHALRTQWELFVSPTRWTWGPLRNQWGWNSPVVRYALRCAMAMGAGYAIALQLPWTSHHYWVLLAVVAVTRGNLAQTLERRNARMMGTLVGCLIVWLFLAADPSPQAVLLVLAISAGIAHAFVIRRYFYTAIAATLLGLLMGHLMHSQSSPTFAVMERIADTLVGVAVGWLMGYVLPTWESKQLPRLVERSLRAQNQHAQSALTLLAPADSNDLPWRLARREAYDSLSALTVATQRSLVEPHQVRPALAPLEAVQARSYQLLAQLSAVKSLLLLRQGQLNMTLAQTALQETAQRIHGILNGEVVALPADTDAHRDVDDLASRQDALALPDLTPWLLRRLHRATLTAHALAQAAKP